MSEEGPVACFCSDQVEGTQVRRGSFVSSWVPLEITVRQIQYHSPHLPQEPKPQLRTANQHSSACADQKTEKLLLCP